MQEENFKKQIQEDKLFKPQINKNTQKILDKMKQREMSTYLQRKNAVQRANDNKLNEEQSEHNNPYTYINKDLATADAAQNLNKDNGAHKIDIMLGSARKSHQNSRNDQLSARFESTNKDKISTTKGSASKTGSMTERGPNRMADVHGINLRSGVFKEA